MAGCSGFFVLVLVLGPSVEASWGVVMSPRWAHLGPPRPEFPRKGARRPTFPSHHSSLSGIAHCPKRGLRLETQRTDWQTTPLCHMPARTPTNDEPEIDINLLPERQRLLKKLVEDIRHCSPPMVFGVHGDWGAGKTSFLQAVMYELTGSCPMNPDSISKERTAHPEWKAAPLAVWFEAWRYQNESAPIIALLHELRTQFGAWAKTVEIAKEVGGTVWRNLMLAFDSIVLKIEAEAGIPGNGAKVGAQVSPFQMAKAQEANQKARFSTPLPSNQIREALDEVFKGLLGAKKKGTPQHRIVIFIDDLDRCSASSMFSLLESIKIYLNLKHCVFVLGINRHELERNIASILPEPLIDGQREVRAHEYIEKLCGNIIRLPYPSATAQQMLVNKWLRTLDAPSREALVALVGEHECLPLNPRRIKMWCNTVIQLFEHRYAELRSAPAATEFPALALVACLHSFYPCLHQGLQSAPSFWGAIKKWCVAEQRMEPDLKVFEGLMRVFVMPRFIMTVSEEEREATYEYEHTSHGGISNSYYEAERRRLDRLAPILNRAYAGLDDTSEVDDKAAEPPGPKPIRLLTDPSSLQYFHPQRLAARAQITEKLITHYLHLD